MIHYMKLVPLAFSKIADGSKTIELRLNDEKREKIKIGDTIVFSCTENNDLITSLVKALHKYPDFKNLFNALPLTHCGYLENELSTAHYTDMEQFYSKDQIAKYGALGIELCEVSSICNVKESITDFSVLELLSPSVFNPTGERLLARTEKYLSNKNAFVYAYRISGEYKGIVVFEFTEKIATILDIAVKPEYQGRGIGSKLIDFIFNSFEVEKIIAETDDDAIVFYKKYGFAVTNCEKKFNTNRYNCVCEHICAVREK